MDLTITRGEQPHLINSVQMADGETEPTEAEISRRVDALAPMTPTGKVWLWKDCLGKWQMWIELGAR
jgi:hypothetical protein